MNNYLTGEAWYIGVSKKVSKNISCLFKVSLTLDTTRGVQRKWTKQI